MLKKLKMILSGGLKAISRSSPWHIFIFSFDKHNELAIFFKNLSRIANKVSSLKNNALQKLSTHTHTHTRSQPTFSHFTEFTNREGSTNTSRRSFESNFHVKLTDSGVA